VTFKPEKTVRKVLEAVLHGDASIGVVPAENSTFGSVVETYDALVNPSLPGSATIAGEHVLPINHALIVRHGVSTEDIHAVYSHPQVSINCYLFGPDIILILNLQALGQCANYLTQNLPNASKHEVSSTGAAVDLLLGPPSDENTRIAAIASEQYVKLHPEIEILASNIQDLKGGRKLVLSITLSSSRLKTLTCSGNRTRFFVLTKSNWAWSTQATSFMIRYTSPYAGIASMRLDLIDAIPFSAIKRIDRRPSNDPTPFRDTIFVEVDIRLLPGGNSEATKVISSTLLRAKEAGAEAACLGAW